MRKLLSIWQEVTYQPACNHDGDWQCSCSLSLLKPIWLDWSVCLHIVWLAMCGVTTQLGAFAGGRESKQRFDEDDAFKTRAREAVTKLQSGDPAYLTAWQLLCEISRKVGPDKLLEAPLLPTSCQDVQTACCVAAIRLYKHACSLKSLKWLHLLAAGVREDLHPAERHADGAGGELLQSHAAGRGVGPRGARHCHRQQRRYLRLH